MDTLLTRLGMIFNAIGVTCYGDNSSMVKNNTVYRMPESPATEVTDDKDQMIS